MRIRIIDAFTDRPFAGNPAAVCLLEGDGWPDEGWMRQVAAEMNLSETAFAHPLPGDAEADWALRWFTPTVETNLCGHATLASAHVLWQTGRLPPDAPARFHTRSGLLTADQRGDWIELDFPAEPEQPVEAPAGLLEALGVAPRYVGRGRSNYLVEVDSERTVRGARPDFARLGAALPTNGIILTSRSESPPYDFVSRFFMPGGGIDEDPVTGAAHCCLGPHWAAQLGKREFVAYQASARGGVVRVRVEGDRVLLGGQAVTVLRGELAD